MKTKRINLRVNERTWNQIKKVAEYIDQDISSTLRNSLRYGLNSLLKFETSGQMDLKKLEAGESQEKEKAPEHQPVDQERVTFEDHGDYIIFFGQRMTREEWEEKVRIARTPWLPKNE